MREKWLIVGTPWVGREFCSTLQKNGQEIVAIWSLDLDTAKEWAKEFAIDRTLNDFERIDFEYDNVYIAVPNKFHFEIAKRFINLGKNTMIEKPITHSFETTKELFELSDSKGVKVMESYPHIYPGKLERYRGKVKNLEINMMYDLSNGGKNFNRPQFKRETYGGAIPDMGVYPIAMALWINGSVESFEFLDIDIYKDQVEQTLKFKLNHKNGSNTISEISISKDDPRGEPIIADGKKIHESVSRLQSKKEDRDIRMKNELLLFLSDDYKATREISLEVAKLVDEMKRKVEEKINENQ